MFDYENRPEELMTSDVMGMVSAIHEHRGKQELYRATKPEVLEKLCEVAMIQSTAASNRIENIKTSDKRLRDILAERIEPKNRDEREIAGYRYVLDMIHTQHEHIPVTPNVILQFHRDLYRQLDLSFAGNWKDGDNQVQERLADGSMAVRFQPTSAARTPAAVENLCSEYNKAVKLGKFDPLILSAMFVFDFVSIHPFNDGNGRMSRLLTLLLLYKSNYLVGKYVSIEQEIEKTKDTYYDALGASSAGWHEGKNDYLPFVSYLLGVVLACYKTLDARIETASTSSSEELVRDFFESHLGTASKRDVTDACPTISTRTVERILKKLLDEGSIEKTGAARATRYRRVD